MELKKEHHPQEQGNAEEKWDKCIGNDEHKSFRYFYEYFKFHQKDIEGKTLRDDIWQKVKEYFQIFQEWYNDLELYHYIGYLIENGWITTGELIKTWKVPGQPTVSFNSNDIAALRKAHINTIVQLNNGESYLGPGFGITASGSPAEATHKYVDIMHAINSYIQTWEKNPLPLLRVKYSEAEILKMNAVQFDFSLRFVPPNKLEAVDRIHGIVVQMFEQRSFLKDCR